MQRKLLTLLFVAFVAYFVIQNPGTAADFVRAFVSGGIDFAQALASGGGQ